MPTPRLNEAALPAGERTQARRWLGTHGTCTQDHTAVARCATTPDARGSGSTPRVEQAFDLPSTSR